MLKKRDDQLQSLQDEKLRLDTENAALKEQLRVSPKIDEAAHEALQKEVANLREQMSKLITGKYKTDKNTEIFMNNDYDKPQSTVQSAAARTMSFFESAAQVTARVAGSLAMSTETLETSELRPLQVRPFEYQDDSLPRDVIFVNKRPVRMLEALELQDEITDSLITNLRIPLPSTQTIATRREIFFPAHLMGYLLSELLQHRMVERLRDIFGLITRGKLFNSYSSIDK